VGEGIRTLDESADKDDDEKGYGKCQRHGPRDHSAKGIRRSGEEKEGCPSGGEAEAGEGGAEFRRASRDWARRWRRATGTVSPGGWVFMEGSSFK